MLKIKQLIIYLLIINNIQSLNLSKYDIESINNVPNHERLIAGVNKILDENIKELTIQNTYKNTKKNTLVIYNEGQIVINTNIFKKLSPISNIFFKIDKNIAELYDINLSAILHSRYKVKFPIMTLNGLNITKSFGEILYRSNTWVSQITDNNYLTTNHQYNDFYLQTFARFHDIINKYFLDKRSTLSVIKLINTKQQGKSEYIFFIVGVSYSFDTETNQTIQKIQYTLLENITTDSKLYFFSKNPNTSLVGVAKSGVLSESDLGSIIIVCTQFKCRIIGQVDNIVNSQSTEPELIGDDLHAANNGKVNFTTFSISQLSKDMLHTNTTFNSPDYFKYRETDPNTGEVKEGILNSTANIKLQPFQITPTSINQQPCTSYQQVHLYQCASTQVNSERSKKHQQVNIITYLPAPFNSTSLFAITNSLDGLNQWFSTTNNASTLPKQYKSIPKEELLIPQPCTSYNPANSAECTSQQINLAASETQQHLPSTSSSMKPITNIEKLDKSQTSEVVVMQSESYQTSNDKLQPTSEPLASEPLSTSRKRKNEQLFPTNLPSSKVNKLDSAQNETGTKRKLHPIAVQKDNKKSRIDVQPKSDFDELSLFNDCDLTINLFTHDDNKFKEDINNKEPSISETKELNLNSTFLNGTFKGFILNNGNDQPINIILLDKNKQYIYAFNCMKKTQISSKEGDFPLSEGYSDDVAQGNNMFFSSQYNSQELVHKTDLSNGVYVTSDKQYYQVIDQDIHLLTLKQQTPPLDLKSLYNSSVPNSTFTQLFKYYIPNYEQLEKELNDKKLINIIKQEQLKKQNKISYIDSQAIDYVNIWEFKQNFNHIVLTLDSIKIITNRYQRELKSPKHKTEQIISHEHSLSEDNYDWLKTKIVDLTKNYIQQ